MQSALRAGFLAAASAVTVSLRQATVMGEAAQDQLNFREISLRGTMATVKRLNSN